MQQCGWAKRKRDSKLLSHGDKEPLNYWRSANHYLLNLESLFYQSSSYLRGGPSSEGILLLSTLFLSTMAVAVPGSITVLVKNLLIGCVPNGAPPFLFLSASASAFVYSFCFCLPLLSLAMTTTLTPVVTVPAIILDVLLLYYCCCYF